jgi:hypothetical protein
MNRAEKKRCKEMAIARKAVIFEVMVDRRYADFTECSISVSGVITLEQSKQLMAIDHAIRNNLWSTLGLPSPDEIYAMKVE